MTCLIPLGPAWGPLYIQNSETQILSGSFLRWETARTAQWEPIAKGQLTENKGGKVESME